MSDLHFRLLGPLEAERGGIALELGPRKQRAVLALLLLEANRVVPTERLIDALWGDAPPETARSALQVYVAGLRKAFGEDGASLRTQGPGYVLELEPGALDLQAFAALVQRRATRPSRLELPRRSTRRSRSGAARRWPTSTERRSAPLPGLGSRSSAWERSRSGSTRTWRSDATPT